MPIGQTYTMGKFAHEWLKHELSSELGRKVETLLSGVGNLKTGSVLGKVTVAGASSAAKAGGNTGGGSLTLDGAPVLAGAKAGVYKVRCVNLVANAGLFSVTDPDGVLLGMYQSGAAAFEKHIKFVMADVGTDFAVGDGFDITVAAGSGKLVWYDPNAVNGAADPYGILLNAADAASADQKCVVITRDAVINPLALTWGAAVDDAGKKSAGLVKLAKFGIRTAAVV